MKRKRRMKRKDGDDKREGEMIDEMRGREKAEEGHEKGASMGRRGRRRKGSDKTGGRKREGDREREWQS